MRKWYLLALFFTVLFAVILYMRPAVAINVDSVMVELSKFMGVFILPIFLAWLNQSVTGTVKKVDTKVTTLATDTGASIGLIRTDLQGIHQEITDINYSVNRINAVKDSKAFQKRQLLTVQDYCVNFLAYDDSLKQFGILQADQFRQLVSDFHDMDIKCDCKEAVIRSGIGLFHQLQIDGYSIMGREFIDYYYETHAKAVEFYFSEICRIFVDPDNSKHERFQEKSVEFLKEFLANLNVAYMKYYGNPKLS